MLTRDSFGYSIACYIECISLSASQLRPYIAIAFTVASYTANTCFKMASLLPNNVSTCTVVMYTIGQR